MYVENTAPTLDGTWNLNVLAKKKSRGTEMLVADQFKLFRRETCPNCNQSFDIIEGLKQKLIELEKQSEIELKEFKEKINGIIES